MESQAHWEKVYREKAPNAVSWYRPHLETSLALIGKAAAVDAVIEQHVGGRWYERGDDGSMCQWGSVLAWEPPSRVVLSSDINADWQHDPTLNTEIEVRFTAESGDRTRVELEHRRLDRYGDRRDEMRRIYDTQGDWGRLLAAFAVAAAT